MVNEFSDSCSPTDTSGMGCDGGAMLPWQKAMPDVPFQRFREWAASGSRPGNLPDAVGPNVAARISREEFLQRDMSSLVFDHGARLGGVVEFSRAALGADRSHALIHVRQHDGMHTGEGFFYLARENAAWIPVARTWWHYL